MEKLGVDWRLFIAQVINFLVLFFVLRKFLYKPMVAMLERRRETIEKSLEDAKKISEASAVAAAQKEEIIREARREAGKIIEEAVVRADALKEEKVLLTKKEVEKIIEQGRVQLAEEKQSALRSVRAESGALVVSAVEAILKGLPHEKLDKSLVEESLKKIK